MAGFRTLQHIVSGYFAHNHWCCGEDHEDDLQYRPLAERWEDERDVCYVTALPSRSWYSLVGHGVGVRITNDKRRFQYHGISEFPSAVSEQFPGIPNRIEVDSHYRCASDGDFIACDLALKIEKSGRGGRIIRVDVDNETTRVKTSPLLDADERFALLARRAWGYLPSNVDIGVLKGQLRRALGPVWPAVSAEARRFLLTGLVQYEIYDSMGRMLLDASPGIIPLASALELEVNRQLLDPFRRWLLITVGPSNQTLPATRI